MKRISRNMALDHSKLVRIFFAVLGSLVLLFIFSSYDTTSDHVYHVRENYTTALKQLPLRSIKEETNKKLNPFVPPRNSSEAERITWLLRILPELDIFKPASEFHSRVDRFFDTRCEVRVFMTWISPAEMFGRRESLAVESLFKAHPKGCLMILSRTLDSVKGRQILKLLLDRHLRVNAVAPDLSCLVNGTPAETWLEELKRGDKDPGEISLAQNLSNLMRLVALYKYGGVYLDTDFIVTKPLTALRNSVGAQSEDVSKKWTRLNNAVLIFDANHPLLWNFIEEFAASFDGNKWGYNGPYLITRVVKRVGPSRPGLSFTVQPPMAFYPVDWTKIGGLFARPISEAQTRWVKAKLFQLRGETYGVHLWNRQSSRLAIEEGSVMERLISQVCIICKEIYTS